jgi:hypothetical protein
MKKFRPRVRALKLAREVGFDAGKVISAIPDTEEQMKRFAFLPFYRRIKQEGVSA